MCGQEKTCKQFVQEKKRERKKERKKESKQESFVKFNKEKTKSEPNHGTTYMQKFMHHGP
jgi:hypothetical protein